MTSQIDPTVPVTGNPTTASVRNNFLIAGNEITTLQKATAGSPFLPLSGSTMTGPMLLYNDPTAPMSPVTLGYFQTHSGGSGGGSGIPEAPNDGGLYGRQSASWQPAMGLGGGTLTGGITYSGTATSITDLSHHISLSGTTYGFNVYSAALDYNVPTASTHNFNIAGATVLQIATGGITSTAPITLPADPTSALQASTRQYVDNAIAGRAIGDAPNDGNAYLRLSAAWHFGVAQLGSASTTNVAVVENTTGADKTPAIMGNPVPYNPGSDGLKIQVKRLGSPTGTGQNGDGAAIMLYGPSQGSGVANCVTVFAGNNAAGFKYFTFGSDGTLTFSGGNSGLTQNSATNITTFLDITQGNGFVQYLATRNGVSRWQLQLMDNATESGGNLGSNFILSRFNDSGSYLDSCFTIGRGNGIATFSQPLHLAVGFNCPNWYGNDIAIGCDTSAGSIHVQVNNVDYGYLMRSHGGGGATMPIITVNTGGTAVTGYIAGIGSCWWSATLNSDRSIKSNIEACAFDALGMIERLPVYSADLRMADNSSVHWNCSLIADEVEQVLPEAYQPPPVEGAVAGLHPLPLITALFRATQQLAQRVAALEGDKRK